MWWNHLGSEETRWQEGVRCFFWSDLKSWVENFWWSWANFLLTCLGTGDKKNLFAMSEEFVTVLSDAACWTCWDAMMESHGVGPSYRKTDQHPQSTTTSLGICGLRKTPWPIRRTIIVHGSTTVLVSQTKSSSSYFSVPEPSFDSQDLNDGRTGVMIFFCPCWWVEYTSPKQ